ncbi:hypothetical protein MASR2M48_07670 [Spirochaetota bacterium]
MDDSNPLLVDTGGGFSIRYRGRWLYSRHRPDAAAKAALASTSITPETLYILPSPCLCYALIELLERLPESSAILCVEADVKLMSLTSSVMTDDSRYREANGSRLVLCSADDALAAYRELEANTAGRFRRAVELSLSGGRALFESVYAQTLAGIEHDIGLRFRNRLSLVRMGRLWARNVISNLGAMDWASIEPFRYDGRPLVVCGAGPSLDRALSMLKSRRDAITIIACDTASGALARAGVMPDAVVCLEAQVYNVGDFLPLNMSPVHLIADISSHPASFHNVSGPKSLTLSAWTDSAFLSRLAAAGLPITTVPALASVGVLALRLARLLGGALIVTGLDFSFNQGKTHCLGSPADIRARSIQTRLERDSASWRASFREGVCRAEDSLTDPALSLYATLAADELADSGGYDLRCGLGARLPLTRLDDVGFDTLIADSASRGPAGAIGAYAAPEINRLTAQAFLSGELARVVSVANALRHGTSDDKLLALLQDADLLYAHFPDPERVLDLQPDALRRVAAEAAYWRGRLEAAIG